MSPAFFDLIELEPTLQSTFGWCAVMGLLGLLLARWKWWSALVTVPFALLCSMHWEFQALIKARPVAGDAALGEEFIAAATSADAMGEAARDELIDDSLEGLTIELPFEELAGELDLVRRKAS